ncbi:AgmX/PglI C-terminal domain-containing protein [Pendulispora albinea]|uniref:AgmX/PglI C-terminal domain-containing protein n=1 Tax=Pendulispora albinea TaxID=2741071 RepID=A0ABZ2LWJ2_9BACT
MTTAMIHSNNDAEFFASLERDDLDQIEATLSWGDDVLEVRHLPAGAGVSIGERADCTFCVPTSQLPPPHVGSDRVELLAAGSAALGRDAPLLIELGPFRIRLRLVPAGRHVPFAWWAALKESALGSVGTSLAVHAMLVGSLAMFLPSLGADDDEAIVRDRIYTMQKYLLSAAERERDAQQESAGPAGGPAESDASGKQALNESGIMGRVNAPTTHGYWSARGDAKPHEATLSREAHAMELAQVRDFGLLGILATSSLSDPNAPVVPWGENLRGADRESHLGAMWGNDPGDNGGIGGLGLSGTGEGGCPAGSVHCGQGIGVGDIGQLGHQLDDHLGHCVGPNCGRGPGGDGRGIGSSPILGAHVPKPPRIRTCGDQACGFEAMGRIPPEVIQRIVRQNAGRYRLCYEHGLRDNPSLNGHVRVKFVIDRNGAVSLAQDGGSDLPDERVRSCVVQSFYALAFPSPEGGTVRVTYPLIFSPAEN